MSKKPALPVVVQVALLVGNVRHVAEEAGINLLNT